MKLLRVHIENFRILKKIEVEFSTDDKNNLTVIRAANESGKTNFLNALQWGFFGESALPDNRHNFRLSPIDNSTNEQEIVKINVEIEYEKQSPTSRKKYRLIRTVSETIRGTSFSRDRPELRLYEITSRGASEISNAEAHISSDLPKELREVFFTDGDRALNFIEGSSGEQRKQVEGAIRSLLGLNVIEEAVKHTRKVIAELNLKVRADEESDSKRSELSARLSLLQDREPLTKEKHKEELEKSTNLTELLNRITEKIRIALEKGDREALAKDLSEVQEQKKIANHSIETLAKDTSNLFKDKIIAKQLLVDHFGKAQTILNDLKKEGKIPSQTIPVLEEQLKKGICICGERLNPNNEEDHKRREHIRELVENSRESDSIQFKASELYFGTKEFLKKEDKSWKEAYSSIYKQRTRAMSIAKQAGQKEKEFELMISEIPDVDLKQLREEREHYKEEHEISNRNEIRLQLELEGITKEIKQLGTEIAELLEKDSKGKKILAEITVANDLADVLETSLEVMKDVELKKVSKRMNSIFLEMIGSEGNENNNITKAEISPDFRILVWSGNHKLSPSIDLNGASRRALTLAFILALTNVSEVEAPNIIDTPLGMTSGYVRKAILSIASQQSSQLILFLTHDEITEIEDILDEIGGRFFTFSNPSLFPRYLKNKPPTDDRGILVCKCNHRENCEICEFKREVNFRDFILEN
jgi:DNA sulfur modification protein DndD